MKNIPTNALYLKLAFHFKFFINLMVNQYAISTAEIKLKPMQRPRRPPSWDMYWIVVILNTLEYSKTVVVSKKKVTIAMSLVYASYTVCFSLAAVKI